MDLTCTKWVSVEVTTTPCDNELENKGKTISTEGVGGLIPKHWDTFRVYDVFSKESIDGNLLEEDVTGTGRTDNSNRYPITGNDG